MGIKLWEELAAQGMIIGMDAAEVLAKKIDALNAANIDLAERVLYAERERDEAYEKGAADMKLRIRMAMCEADTPFRSYDEVWNIAQDAIKGLPLKESK